jgi:hypothetical protein
MGAWLLAFTALVAILALAMRLRKPSDIVMRFIKTNTIRLKEEAIDLARSGFVGFVPLYSPKMVPQHAASLLTRSVRPSQIWTLTGYV